MLKVDQRLDAVRALLAGALVTEAARAVGGCASIIKGSNDAHSRGAAPHLSGLHLSVPCEFRLAPPNDRGGRNAANDKAVAAYQAGARRATVEATRPRSAPTMAPTTTSLG